MDEMYYGLRKMCFNKHFQENFGRFDTNNMHLILRLRSNLTTDD